MKIKIVGNPKSLTKKECKKTAKFFLGLLLTKEEITNKKLCIHFGKKFAFSESSAVEGEGYAYECIDGSYAIWISSKLDRDSKIEILAHEMVHIKQLIRDEFIETESESDYWDNPSEIEAYGRTPGLLARYIDYKNSI